MQNDVLEKSPLETETTKTEFFQMHKQNLSEQDTEIVKEIKKLNNRTIIEFIRVAFGQNPSLSRKEVAEKWMVYSDGLEVRNYMKGRNLLPRPSQEDLQRAREFLGKDVEEIYSYGYSLTMLSYGIIDACNTRRIMELKYEKIFSTEDPQEWFERAKTFKEKVDDSDRMAFEKIKSLSLTKLYI